MRFELDVKTDLDEFPEHVLILFAESPIPPNHPQLTAELTNIFYL